jgi:hypothetical protein
MVDYVRAAGWRLSPSLRYRGFERERMEGAAHLALQRLVDHLVLLDPALAREGSGGDARAVVIAVSGEIQHNDLRIRESISDKALDIRSCHCHRIRSSCNERCYAKSKPTRKYRTNRRPSAASPNNPPCPPNQAAVDVRFPTRRAHAVSDLTQIAVSGLKTAPEYWDIKRFSRVSLAAQLLLCLRVPSDKPEKYRKCQLPHPIDLP